MRQFLGGTKKKKENRSDLRLPTTSISALFFFLPLGKWEMKLEFLFPLCRNSDGFFFWGSVTTAVGDGVSEIEIGQFMIEGSLSRKTTHNFLPDFRPNSSMAATNVVFLCSCVWGANFVRSKKKPSDRK